MDFKYTRLYKVNHKLIVADTLEEAIEIYKSYNGETASNDILSIKAIGDGQIPERYDVLAGVKSSQQ